MTTALVLTWNRPGTEDSGMFGPFLALVSQLGVRLHAPNTESTPLLHTSATHQPTTDAEEQAGQESFSCCLTYAATLARAVELQTAVAKTRKWTGLQYHRKRSVPIAEADRSLVIHRDRCVA
jgi:hypothetical protein